MNTTPFLLQSSLCSILYPRVSQTHTHTVRRHLCHARRIYLKVKRSFTQRKWGRLRCPVPSSPSQRQRQHQRMRTGRRWLAEVQTPHRPAAPGRLVRSSDGDVNRFTPHRPAALRVVFLTDRRGKLVVGFFFISIDFTAAWTAEQEPSCGLGSSRE